MKELYLFWSLIVLFWNIVWVIQYPREIIDVLLFKADMLSLSIMFWAYNLFGIFCLILYLVL